MNKQEEFKKLVEHLVYCLNHYQGNSCKAEFDSYIKHIELLLDEAEVMNIHFAKGFICACSLFMKYLRRDDQRLDKAFSSIAVFSHD